MGSDDDKRAAGPYEPASTRQRILVTLRDGDLWAGRTIAQDPEGRAVLLEIASEAGTPERIAAADALLAAAIRTPYAYGTHHLSDDATLAITSAVYGLASEAESPPVILQALGDPHHYVRYVAVAALEGRLRVHDALVFLRAEARYGRCKATDVGLKALTTGEDLRALLATTPLEDLPFAVLFLSFKGWSEPLRQEARELLWQLLHHPDPAVRAAAALTCPDSTHPDVRAALVDAISVREPWLRVSVVATLAREPAAHPLVDAALRDAEPWFREAVFEELGDSGRETLVPSGDDEPPDDLR